MPEIALGVIAARIGMDLASHSLVALQVILGLSGYVCGRAFRYVDRV